MLVRSGFEPRPNNGREKITKLSFRAFDSPSSLKSSSFTIGGRFTTDVPQRVSLEGNP